MKMYLLQAKAILVHKWFVFVCGRKVGGIPLLYLLIHDLSKFRPSEFFVYSRKLNGGHCFDFEWELVKNLHKHRNPHHPEFWARHDGIHPMPEVFVREMVADWMAVSMSYKDVTPFREWVKANVSKLPFHEETKKLLYIVLAEQGLFI
jgi:hypothetical protein